jgi:hypothetical protein
LRFFILFQQGELEVLQAAKLLLGTTEAVETFVLPEERLAILAVVVAER